MKERNKKLAFWLLLLSFMLFPITVKADGGESNINNGVTETQLIKAKATAYCLPGTMANGNKVHDGACASNKYFGKTIVMYKRLPGDKLGDYIGTYTVEDKGATKGLKNGWVVDVWRPDLSSCQDFMNLVYEDGCKGNIYILVKED